MNKKLLVYAGMGLFLTAGIGATQAPKEKIPWKNLKVLPANLDDEQMERIMYRYTRQLGVTCIFCHVYTKPGITPVRMDFPADDLPQKKTTMEMMRMTDRLNKKYFNYKNDYGPRSLQDAPVSCTTCHRGISKPSNQRLFFNGY